MVKYPLQYEGKAMPMGMRQKRFFVLTGNSLCYYDKLCNSEGQSVKLVRCVHAQRRAVAIHTDHA